MFLFGLSLNLEKPDNLGTNKVPWFYYAGGRWFGVDILKEDIADNFEAFVWEPAIVRENALTAASEAACLILSVDETVQNPKSDMSGDDNPITGKRGRMPGMGR